VARWLRAQGVARGALVPVLSPRSGELPALWLGILWVGAVIVPLDPRWPEARLAEALARLRPAAALAHPTQAARPALAAIPALGWDGEDGEPPPLEPATGHEPVYAIFTSGTTGAPRLALNHARGLNNRLRCMDEAFGKDQITLQTTHHAYDTAIWQLLWPLTRGAQVHVPPDEALVSPEALLGCVRRGVTVLDLVPSVARALAPGLRASPEAARRLASVQHLILGGEAPTVADAAALRSLCPSASLYNIYGPTEATIGCLVHEVRGDAPGPIPMGRPLANVQAVILDARGALALPGVEGELVLGGVCVGLGYAGDPEATARAFPWRDLWGEGTQRLYRTGDRAVYRADGALVFLGRGDGQVKIRGVRLELRGIEAALARAAPQHDLAMLALEGPRGAELVAFVAPGPIPDALPRAAEAILEPAARPARWIALPALPLAPSGKRDEAALRALGLTSPPPRLTTDAPGALGAVLAVWSELLGAPVTDPESNFLQLGGHSLLWVEVQHRLEARLAREIPVSLLLQAPTARALAAHLEAPPADAAPRGRHVVRRPRPA
jgi:amino acid adenylation domain-containing protein